MTKSRATWLFALGAVAAVALTHAQVLGLEFRADDYAILRPWTGAEVREALVGSWSGTRAFQDPYHRPIAGLYHAAISTIFGLHAPAMHLVSLVELAAVVFLLTGIVRRETTRLGVAALSAAVYLTNPLLRDSTSSWIFNQYQLVALLLTGAAVLIWQRRRTAARPAAWLAVPHRAGAVFRRLQILRPLARRAAVFLCKTREFCVPRHRLRPVRG